MKQVVGCQLSVVSCQLKKHTSRFSALSSPSSIAHPCRQKRLPLSSAKLSVLSCRLPVGNAPLALSALVLPMNTWRISLGVRRL